MSKPIRLCLIVIAALCCGCRSGSDSPEPVKHQPAPSIQFERVVRAWDEPVVYETGEDAGILAILESLGGGVGVFDFDRDGRQDLWFPGGGTLREMDVRGLPSLLLRRQESSFHRVGNPARINEPKQYSQGCCIGDFNNDGFPDVLVTGYGSVTLWENCGDGTMQDVTAASGLDDDSWSTSAAWGDLNNDGNLDLYLTHYVDWSPHNHPHCRGSLGEPDVCPPRSFEGLNDSLYMAAGDGRFTDRSATSGLLPDGKGLGVVLVDVDSDADLDIYVANDTTDNFLYVNKGNGTLTEQGVLSGVAVDDLANANGSMGLAIADYDNDGTPDIWVTNYEREVFGLYRGLGDANFLHVSARTGVRRIGELLVGFGCVTGDFDCDGDEDLAVANGHVLHYPQSAPVLQQPLLLENIDGAEFESVTAAPGGYFAQAWAGRGLALLDHDDDGLLDLIFCNAQQPAALVRNVTRQKGSGLRYLLVGRVGNRDAIGARLRLTTDHGSLSRWIVGGGSYLSTSERCVHFGVPAGATVTALEVTWPSGVVSNFDREQLESQGTGNPVQIIVEPSSASNDSRRQTPLRLPRQSRSLANQKSDDANRYGTDDGLSRQSAERLAVGR